MALGTMNYIKQAAKEQLESDLAALKSAYDKNNAVYDQQAKYVPQQYDAVKNEAAAQDALSRKAFAEYAAANGLTSGAAGQSELARGSALQRTLADINRDQQDTLSDIDAARNQLLTEYQNAQAQVQADNKAQLNNALYNEMVRKLGSAASLATTLLPYALGTPKSGVGLLGAIPALASILSPANADFESSVTGDELSAPAQVVQPAQIGGRSAADYTAAASNYSTVKSMVDRALAAGDKTSARNILTDAYGSGALNLTDYTRLVNMVRG